MNVCVYITAPQQLSICVAGVSLTPTKEWGRWRRIGAKTWNETVMKEVESRMYIA